MKTIREWKISDAKSLEKALNNRKIQDNLRDGLPYPYSEKDAEDFIISMLEADKNNVFAFAIVAEGNVIGSIGLFRQNNIHYRSAEMGYYIAEPFWGRGITTNAIKEICQYAFSHTNIVRIFAEPFSSNIASCKALEKSGFNHEGTLHKNAEKNGVLIDMEMYSLVKN